MKIRYKVYHDSKNPAKSALFNFLGPLVSVLGGPLLVLGVPCLLACFYSYFTFGKFILSQGKPLAGVFIILAAAGFIVSTVLKLFKKDPEAKWKLTIAGAVFDLLMVAAAFICYNAISSLAPGTEEFLLVFVPALIALLFLISNVKAISSGLHIEKAETSQSKPASHSHSPSATERIKEIDKRPQIVAFCSVGPIAGTATKPGFSIFIGRQGGSDLRFPPSTAGVSDKHCMLTTRVDDSGKPAIFLINLCSNNGVFLANGDSVGSYSEVQVENGATFYLGSTQIAVTVTLV